MARGNDAGADRKDSQANCTTASLFESCRLLRLLRSVRARPPLLELLTPTMTLQHSADDLRKCGSNLRPHIAGGPFGIVVFIARWNAGRAAIR